MNMTQIESKEDEDEEEDDYNGDDPDGIEEYGEDIAIDDMSTWIIIKFYLQTKTKQYIN